MNWLSYGGGVNSTALAVLLASGKLPEYLPFRVLFADTYDEESHTYRYINDVFRPWCELHGIVFESVAPAESVLSRWQRLKVTGSRIIRSCTDEAKIKPQQRHRAIHGGPDDVILIGIHADEHHRAKRGKDDKGLRMAYPLVELGLGQEDCRRIIAEAGLPVPGKSGCWHCPFKKVGQVIHLALADPCRFRQIIDLEAAATERHGLDPSTGGPRCQWNKTPAAAYLARARRGSNPGELFENFTDEDDERPCGCMDG